MRMNPLAKAHADGEEAQGKEHDPEQIEPHAQQT